MINVARVVAALTVLTFAVVAVWIVFSGPTRSNEGFFIRSVEAGSPADIAGVAGILTHVNGRRISSVNELADIIYENLGEPMSWTVIDNNVVRILEITPFERPEVGQSPTGIVALQHLTRPVGRKSRLMDVAPIAYVGIGLFMIAELFALRRRHADDYVE
ncbi:MAG: hypothetical protein IH960_09300 [Chloroflexi bacterium]|nr:hypothetical protein [Chloroflexota bacterium]